MPDHEHADHHDYHHHHAATGERFIPELMGGEILEAEHQARYRLATPHVSGLRVLDAGCGVGWGSKLLLESGAAVVTGLDISEEALDDARTRVPGAEFVLGDLQALPFPDADFDVIVCFEALEHVEDVGSTLDGLVRVLAPEGVLFVSSPNPAVYPEGNPFHPSEMTPEDLEAAVLERLPHVTMFHQHDLAVSLIAPQSSGPVIQTPMLSLTGFAAGHDPYSVAVASRSALPDVTAFSCAAPPTELKRLAAERLAMIQQLEDAHRQLRDADTSLRGVMVERDGAVERINELTTQAGALRIQLENQRRAADNAGRERDDLTIALISADRPVRTVAPAPAAPPKSETKPKPPPAKRPLRRRVRSRLGRDARRWRAIVRRTPVGGGLARVKRRLSSS